ncbi:acyl-CoA dehydrogenase family protein [Aurantimonas sp. VKM B-3413]|uniref:acyl-CoA dehydrogenase family protein n=1 Tax=Aurantimonas sp. VKM B-3413 TaxID=2779401 RepID=UPI001E4684F2|nr:acyl-CoA dehydrogenase family protein [Aurantimonas sp. VKM B-3413]MCB8837964.1 acyl-CoA/acyl-ACP dehydrogenase [Aurantimonas sp. VKM B-3413]
MPLDSYVDPASHFRAQVSGAAALDAAETDASGEFPRGAMAALGELGVLGAPPLDDPHGLLRLLWAVGRGNLSVGRIVEGHVNAVWLVRQFGSDPQIQALGEILRAGGTLGIWNTDLPGRPLRLEEDRLVGGKTFATGVDGLSHALVTAATEAGRQMLLVPVEGLHVDRSWWKPLGMRASGSHLADFTGLSFERDWLVGGPDDYIRQPWFSGGAIRFVAVQLGGVEAVLDAMLAHLGRTARTEDPYQRHRIGRAAIALHTGRLWVEQAADAWTAASRDPALGPELIAIANATRSAGEAAALAVLEEAERGVGAAGMIAPHPLERLIRDLRTYLRQPNPDGALAAVGQAVADGTWLPGFREREA